MAEDLDSNIDNPKTGGTRAGGPDDSRAGGPDDSRAGGPDDSRKIEGGGKESAEETDIPRGAPKQGGPAPK